MDSTILTQFAILVPVTIGVVQVIKMAGLPDRFAPITALVIGVAGSYILIGGDVKTILLQGLVVGLSACGLYAGAKATITG